MAKSCDETGCVQRVLSHHIPIGKTEKETHNRHPSSPRHNQALVVANKTTYTKSDTLLVGA